MSTLQANADVLVLAVPMLAALFITFFRLDQLLSRSQPHRVEAGRPLSQWDENGSPLCVEPDGRVDGQPARLFRSAYALAEEADRRRRVRVRVEWVEE